ncbi:MAG TPA: GNAT family N-acetyltransferase [Candidatus Saccharimonas sp.]|nr:GNAT family N-acetyltransferase [Candidatus Saccharimonas sp.]
MFGLPMKIEVPDRPKLILRMPDEADLERMAAGMTRREVTRYLMHQRSYTVGMERDWVTMIAADDNGVAWGVHWVDDQHPDGRLIGTTSLRLKPGNQAESGFVVFDPDYWQQGVATTAHIARTWYAFAGHMCLDAVVSHVQHPNAGSRKALEKTGYAVTGRSYRIQVSGGEVRHLDHLLMVNPDEPAWSYFWGDTEPPAEFAEARDRTLATLELARKYVSFDL